MSFFASPYNSYYFQWIGGCDFCFNDCRPRAVQLDILRVAGILLHLRIIKECELLAEKMLEKIEMKLIFLSMMDNTVVQYDQKWY